MKREWECKSLHLSAKPQNERLDFLKAHSKYLVQVQMSKNQIDIALIMRIEQAKRLKVNHRKLTRFLMLLRNP